MWDVVDPATDVSPPAFPFTAQPGPRIPLSRDADPIEFFQLFFGEDTREILVNETNR